MNRQRAHGQLLQITGALREGWGRVISDQTMQARGEMDRLHGRSQAREGALKVILLSQRLGPKSSERR